MVYDKLPGVYFTESVTSELVYTQEYNPLFIIQTSNEISSLDDQTIEFNSFDSFKTLVMNKGLTNTIDIMENILLEGNVSTFYVHSIKTDTSTGFTDLIKGTDHLDDITDIIYIEETKSSQSNPITSKITALKNGVIDNAENGIFRKVYIIPYGTVTDAINNAGDTPLPEVIITVMTSITTGEGHGRICIVLPDSLAGSITGKCISSPYNIDAGASALSNVNLSNIYNFNSIQMKTLQNNGILFAKPEKTQGITEYRINFAVTTSFKESKADGQLICRSIADEMLRQIGFECQKFIKARESESTKVEIDAVTGAVIDRFVDNEDVQREGTEFEVSESDNMTFYLNGTIQPIGSTFAIEVTTTLL